MFKKLTINGLRGFSAEQSLEFAVPNSEKIGLTVVVGANNTGKSTIIEAIRALAIGGAPSFAQGRRNVSAGDKVSITIEDLEGRKNILTSIRSGGSETRLTANEIGALNTRILALPSRRVFSPYFGRHSSSRSDYVTQMGFPPSRSSQLDQFSSRLFNLEKDRAAFDQLLTEILGYPVNWAIDQSDQGLYFLKVNNDDGAIHSSEGMGEGLISLMYIVDALHDSGEGDLIVIDEPELSLHPQYQKNLLSVISRFAEKRQILISTHSPYFVDLSLLGHGLTLYRTSKRRGGTEISRLTENSGIQLSRLLENDNNPHILGLTAREALFSGDGVLLLEGQEDVVFLERVIADLGLPLDVATYGWGVGGADNMLAIASMLRDLGFRKVVGILDGDKRPDMAMLRNFMPEFYFDCIPAKDIRTKKSTKARDTIKGLLDEKNKTVRHEYRDETIALFGRVNEYISAPASM